MRRNAFSGVPNAAAGIRLAGGLALSLVLSLGGCAPNNTNTTYAAGGIGVAAEVRYGTVVGMQPVAIAGSQSGLGAGIGGVSGALLGSTAGYGGRGYYNHPVAGIAGTVVGGLVGAGAGALIENSATSGSAMEFVIRPDGGGPDYTLVQSNELGIQVGERVMVSFGDRARLNRVAAGPPGYPPGYPAAYRPPGGGAEKM
jgi:outer membrane lipoprotein SlyB